jgi:hypothetical protein
MKKILVIGIVLLFVATMGASVTARTPVGSSIYGYTDLYEKDQSWNIVPGGAYGFFMYIASGYYQFTTFIVLDVHMKCKVMGLDPITEYAIIAYHEDWPNFDLIYTETTDSSGSFYVWDSIAGIPYDKIWVVPTSDINTCTEQFTTWNPSEYLFENTLL